MQLNKLKVRERFLTVEELATLGEMMARMEQEGANPGSLAIVRLLILTGIVMVFGGATLALHNQIFIQWKPTIFNWALAIVLVATRRWSGKSAMQKAMGEQLQLPPEGWLRLDRLWTGYFLLVGGLNLAVAYGFSESTWVSYKLYSARGFTVVLSLVTAAVLMPYLREPNGDPPADAT